MKHLRNHGLFLAIAAYVFQSFFFTQNVLWFIVLILFLWRCRFLERTVQYFLLFTLLVSAFSCLRIVVLPKLDLGEGDYQIQVDPLMVQGDDQFVTAQAQLMTANGKVPISLIANQCPEFFTIQEVSLIKVEGQLTRPAPARNFGVFSYARYLQTQRIDYQLEVTTFQSQIPVQSLTSKILNWRFRWLAHFQQLDQIPLFSLYNRLIWNLSSTQYKTHRELLMEFGIIHFFAISGFHVTLIKRNIDYLFRRMGVLNEISSILIDGLLILYAFLTAFPIGVIRSVGSHFLKKYTSGPPMDNLSWITLMVIWWNPRIVLATGFQLSFLIALILMFIEQNEANIPLKAEFQLAIICTLFTWPITMRQNFEWYPLQMGWGLLVGKVFDWAVFPFAVVMTALSFSTKGISMMQSLDFIFEPFSIWQPKILMGQLPLSIVIVLLAIAGWWLIDWKKAVKWTIISYGLLVLMAGRWHGERIILLDVGQGDAMLYQAALQNEGWLIDVGGRLNWADSATQLTESGKILDEAFADKTIIPALKALGVRKLDGIVITHPDVDHFGNLPALLNHFPVKKVVITPTAQKDETWQQVMQPVSHRITVDLIGENQWYALIPKRLWAWANAGPFQEDNNNSSIITYLTLPHVSLLNMGDLAKSGEIKWLSANPKIKADILKLGHHGSETSTSQELLEQTNPRFALASVGVNNRYGHPHQTVVDLLSEYKIPLLSTQQVGAVEIVDYPFIGIRIRTVLTAQSK